MEAKIRESGTDTFVNFYKTEEEIQTLIEGFRSRTLPAAQWTHEAHLVTGLWFNYRYSDLEAICYLRSGIISYNISTGGENSPERVITKHSRGSGATSSTTSSEKIERFRYSTYAIVF